MSSAMDKALLALSLDEEEEPFTLPAGPEFCSSENNVLSLIGRTLNPSCQKMANLILDMPRKWEKLGRIRGVALTKERFQFIFKYEHDLIEVLERGVQTHNEWTVAMERWVEQPPEDYLQFVPIWVQIRNIPVNHYTKAAITALGELVGSVITVAFDPLLSQRQDCVRVQVKFDVSKPLKKSREINLPNGEKTTIHFFYEKIQKCCYFCHRLTHDQMECPLKARKNCMQGSSAGSSGGAGLSKPPPATVLSATDPLFGVLEEEQVGMDPLSGRPKIAKEVLEEMRQYLLMANEGDRKLREERVKSSVRDAEKDPIARKTILRLEPAPIFSSDINKGKGIVFDYESAGSQAQFEPILPPKEKLLSAAINSGNARSWQPLSSSHQSENSLQLSSGKLVSFGDCSTVYRAGYSNASLSGTKPKKPSIRRMPGKSTRKLKTKQAGTLGEKVILKEGLSEGILIKRKAEASSRSTSKVQRLNTQLVVPKEGPSNHQ